MKTTNLDFRFSKEYARNQMNLWGKLLCWTGVAKMYLDEGDWKPHFRLLHPLSWIIVMLFALRSAMSDFVEIFRLFRVDKNNKALLWMKDAPEFVIEGNEFVAAPLETLDIFAAKHGFSYQCLWILDEVSRVLVKTGYPCFYKDETGEHILYVSEIDVPAKQQHPSRITVLGKTEKGAIKVVSLSSIIKGE